MGRLTLDSLLRSRIFRAVFAIIWLWVHVRALTHLAEERFGREFNRSPETPPAFENTTQTRLPHWDRLVVARWDAEHYESMAAHGYSLCKPRESLAPGEYPDDTPGCTLAFYPTYGWVGRAIAAITHQPVDVSLFWISILSSLVFLWTLTSPTITDALGVRRAYLAAILFNIFTTGFALVTVQTEPLMLGLTAVVLLAVHRRMYFVASLLAGAATAVRVSAVGTGFAVIAAILVETWRERPTPATVLRRALYLPLCGWGIMSLLVYFQVRFGDPFIYAHAHQRAFHHKASIWNLLWPDGRLMMQSIWASPHDGLFVVATLLWFALGHKEALRRFDPRLRAFLYVYFFVVVGIALVGTAGFAFGGAGRYMLQAFPLFFAMAAVLARKVVALGVWSVASLIHYYNGNACFYVSQNEPDRMQKCSFALDGNYRHWDFVKDHLEEERIERQKKKEREMRK